MSAIKYIIRKRQGPLGEHFEERGHFSFFQFATWRCINGVICDLCTTAERIHYFESSKGIYEKRFCVYTYMPFYFFSWRSYDNLQLGKLAHSHRQHRPQHSPRRQSTSSDENTATARHKNKPVVQYSNIPVSMFPEGGEDEIPDVCVYC